MHAIENAAFVSIGRASGFAGLGIFCIMFGLSFDPAFAARTGGALCTGVAALLAFRAFCARTRPYKRTELWIILAKNDRPPTDVTQAVIGEALRESYVWFARSSALISVVLLVSAVVLQLTA